MTDYSTNYQISLDDEADAHAAGQGGTRRSVPTLKRTTLRTSRSLDFASEKELVAQTGHRPGDWPVAFVKETLDNGTGASEEVGIAPEITITVDGSGITVADSGTDLPKSIIDGVLDFNVRVSSRKAYVSPTPGAQGNALKTLVAMPFVPDGEHGRTEIEALGIRSIIEFRVDRNRQEPVINLTCEPSNVKSAALVRVICSDSARPILDEADGWFLQLAYCYGWTNPHVRDGGG